MIFELVKYLPVYLGSMVKFIAGPTAGMAMGLGLVETAILTMLGTMTTVFLFMTMGSTFRAWHKKRYPNSKKKVFTKKNRRFVTVWQKFGVLGVAILTPVLFTPIGGAILVAYVGAPKKEVYLYMFLSSTFWAFVVTWGVQILFNM